MSRRMCPACGGKNIILQHKEHIISESFGGQKTIKINEYRCSDCGTYGDFFNENDENIHNAIAELKSNAVIKILEDFIQQKISLSSIERVLELPQRTLAKWKNKNTNPTSTGVALFKFLKLFPWLLEVAENKYNYETAQKIFLNASLKELVNKISFNENDIKEAGMITTDNSTLLYKYYKKTDNVDSQIKMINNNMDEVSFHITYT